MGEAAPIRPKPAPVLGLTVACCAVALHPLVLYWWDVPTFQWGRLLWGPVFLSLLVLGYVDRVSLRMLRSGESAFTMLAPICVAAAAILCHDWLARNLDTRLYMGIWISVSVIAIWLAARAFCARPRAGGGLALIMATCLLWKLVGNTLDAYGFTGMFFGSRI